MWRVFVALLSHRCHDVRDVPDVGLAALAVLLLPLGVIFDKHLRTAIYFSRHFLPPLSHPFSLPTTAP